MKICIIASSLHLMGGQSVQAADLIARFNQDNISVGFLPINPVFTGVWGRIQKIKYVRTFISWPAYVLNLFRLIPRFDVLHLFSASYLSFLLAPAPAAIIGKLFGKRVVLNYHSGEAEDHLRRSLKSIKAVLRFVDHVVVPSEYLQQVFRQFNIEVAVIPNIVEMEVFQFQVKQQYRPRFIVSRNLEPLYNVGCVIRSFRIIQERFPGAVLTILGSGSQEQELKDLSAQLELRNVHFVGRVERIGISKYYADHDIMLNASNIDNMPLSILEAFSAGLPVVSTEAGGIPNLIEHRTSGMLVPLNSHDALAACAIELIENQSLAAFIAQKAHDECLRKYSWEVIRNQWLTIYGAAC